jgi:uncharacterized membrane protein SpoIIM required for sporulation
VNAARDLPSAAFRRERESSWGELERILAKIETLGVKSLTATELADVPHLYRTTLSSLSIARAISLDKNLVEYLETLATRAYFRVYGPPRRFLAAVAAFFLAGFPRAVRAFRWQIAFATAILVAGTITGFTATAHDPEEYFSFVPEAIILGRDPGATTEQLRASLYGTEGGLGFATFLFAHNSRVGILCFALGFAAGLPVFLLLMQTGAMLGAFGALFQSRGLGVELWAWLLPHGITELLAIVLCAAGGLVVAQRLILPGRKSRLESLAEGGREAGKLATGAVVMLLIAGLIEGIFRQEVQDVGVRYAVAALTAALWAFYFTRVGRRRRPA